MLVEKEIVPPGEHWYIDQETKLPRVLTATPQLIQYWHDQGNAMRKEGIKIPVPLEHQKGAGPFNPGDVAADKLRNNSGWVEGYSIKDGKLFAALDIQDPDIAKKLPRTIRYCSPWFSTFVDGKGKKWTGVVSHVALTTTPRIHGQEPFASVAAALSVAEIQADVKKFKIPKGGVILSKAGLLKNEGGARRPAYPVAFSLFSCAALAETEVEEFKKKKKTPEGSDSEEEETFLDAEHDSPESPESLEESMVSPDGDISVYDVICDLLGSEGYDVPPGTTKDNFPERLYKVLMDKLKTKTDLELEDNMGNKPPDGKNDLPKNPPVVEERSPAFMSVEEINAIPDANLKRVALSVHAERERTNRLEKAAIDAAKAVRKKRLDAYVKKARLGEADVKKLFAQSEAMAFSLGDDGIVADSMAPVLDILEAGAKDIPAMLGNARFAPVEEPHPAESEGAMSEARRKAVVDELARNGGVPKATAPAAK